MKEYDKKLELKNNQAEFDQKIAQQAQAMNDPVQAISTMVEEYKKLGIPLTRSTQQIISDFQRSGKDLPSYLTDLQKLIQSKPEYKKIKEIEMGKLSDAEKLKMGYQFDLTKMGIANQYSTKADIRNFDQQKELALMTNDQKRAQFLFEMENDPEKRAKAYEIDQKIQANKSLFDILGKNVGTYQGNRGYDLAGGL